MKIKPIIIGFLFLSIILLPALVQSSVEAKGKCTPSTLWNCKTQRRCERNGGAWCCDDSTGEGYCAESCGSHKEGDYFVCPQLVLGFGQNNY